MTVKCFIASGPGFKVTIFSLSLMLRASKLEAFPRGRLAMPELAQVEAPPLQAHGLTHKHETRVKGLTRVERLNLLFRGLMPNKKFCSIGINSSGKQ